jgi:ribosomal protein S18 acetylase RimI-like enzyme
MSTSHQLPVLVRLVPFESDDYRTTVALRRAVLLDPFGIPLALARADDQHALHLGAFLDEECVGCLFLVDRTGGTWQLRQMAVRTECQRTGIGRRLVLEAMSRAREAGATQLLAHAREPAVAVYERLGFTVTGEPFEQVGLPHRTVMQTL